MYKKRLFLMLVAIGSIIVVAFTVRETVAQAIVNRGSRALECASLPSRYSLHTEYMPERETWVTYTEDGPTGVDGGLIHLLSAYRTCSK
jgi:hypothetical protein